jgi:methanogenic corrinoid protein MtbC1/DNA-binding XRE family transcriptional regulator
MVATLEKFAADASAEYFDAKQKRLTHAIVNGDHESADQITGELISAQQTLGDIYLKVVTPALEGVGESWCRGDIGVGEQKLATEIVIGQLDRLRAHFAPPARRSLYRVMVACIEGEQHYIGARMLADLCGARGWHVDFLGASVPNEALVAMVHRRHPQVVGLSVTMTQGVENVRLVLGELEKSAPEVRVIVAGQAVVDNPSVRNLSRRCEIAEDIMVGVGSIARLLRADRPKSVLKEYQMVLARRVRDLRTKRGWTQEHLAQVTQVARACIIAVEGAKQNVSMDILVRMANALEVPPETLLSADG